MIDDYCGFPKWLENLMLFVGLISFIAFSGGMIFLFIMMTWFPEWEMKYEKHQEVKRHMELSEKLGRTATMSEYYKSLKSVDVSTNIGFVDAVFGIKK